MEKQNVTLSLPKDLLKKAKAIAVMEDSSLSDLLRETLAEKVKEKTGHQRAKSISLGYGKGPQRTPLSVPIREAWT
ncbi:MAG: type II toxin-antitoxin system CcdA family antitoxin [Thermodesulfovibrionales bacterium]|nr:type II toxin-antitoxin system CcdA family antitoxin [Thermodesulfovibrionales bacterium]